jgi:tetratricopeptide (TPR) repeat protein
MRMPWALSILICFCSGLAGGVVGTASSSPPTPSMPLFKGLGPVHHPVTTKSELAQRYFDQGLKLNYGFNHDEAERSFRAAAKADPSLAMAYWGVALVLGPNYNLPGDKDRGRSADASIKHAQALAPAASPVNRDLIGALAHRYGANGEPSTERDRAYANAMRTIAYRYPDDPDVQVLFAESLMDLHPWELWTADGKPGENTDEILHTLEAVLKKHPEHIGANHYYIHAVEASSDPARAIPSADRLGKLAPGSGHLVHMPSHIYIRIGRYHDAEVVNIRAVQVDTAFLRQTGESGYYALGYYLHNYHFLCYVQMSEGRGEAALNTSRELARRLPLAEVRAMPMAEYLVPTPLFVEARFGMWDALLREPPAPQDLPFVNGSWHYARGLAFANKGQFARAASERGALEKIITRTPSDRPLGTSNHARDVLTLASTILAGQIAANQRNHTEAIAKFQQAVKDQDTLIYDEPPDWYYPVRESLGAELLASGDAAGAERVYREDLEINPGNPRSLHDLVIALRMEGKTQEAAEAEKQFRNAWQYADTELTQPMQSTSQESATDTSAM